jgi:hypothetical protein
MAQLSSSIRAPLTGVNVDVGVEVGVAVGVAVGVGASPTSSESGPLEAWMKAGWKKVEHPDSLSNRHASSVSPVSSSWTVATPA